MTPDALKDARYAVRPVAPSEFDEVAHCLGRAFQEDPVAMYFFPKETAKCYGHFARVVMDTLRPHIHYATIDGLTGAALWQPPSPPKEPFVKSLFSAARLLWAAGSAFGRVAGLGQAMEEHRPNEPHWYLAMLGTDPSEQSRGIGSALVHETLARCDHEGTPAYLETSTEKNIRFYENHGFQVEVEIRPSVGPRLWTMSRLAR
ncbi:GNAT family N-acetyltransferase [Myxococcota bacterium]|nr:GNAT family N-acetyltransferase [Myxococcota bacterium]